MKKMDSNKPNIFTQSIPLLVVLLCIVLMAAQIVWLSIDTRPTPTGDENTIMVRTLTFVNKLVRDGFSFEMIDQLSHYGRPPLYQLLSVPFVLIFGRSMDSGVYVNMLFYVLLLVATYNIGKVVHSRQAGLLAAILVGTYPTMVRISHLYRPSFALAACTALTMWLLLLLVKTRSIKYAWLTSLSLAFGLFIHPTFAWGVPIPVVLVYVYIVLTGQEGGGLASFRELPGWLHMKLKHPVFLLGILPSGLVAVGIVSMWYVAHGDYLLNVLSSLSSPEMTELMDFDTLVMGFKEEYPPLLMYALTSPHAISIVFAVFAGIGLIYAFIKRSIPGLIMAVSFILSYIILSLQPTLGWRYFAQLLPLVAVLSVIWIFSLRVRWLSILLIIICVSISVLNLVFVTVGLSGNLIPVAGAMGAYLNVEHCSPSYALFCSEPPKNQNWPIASVISDIVKDPVCNERNCYLTVISKNPFFSFATFKYQIAQDFPDDRLILTQPGLNLRLNVQPFIFASLLESDYIIYQDVSIRGSTSNIAIALRVLREENTPLFSASHQDVARYPLPGDSTAILITRIKPLTSGEAEEIVKAVNISGIYSILKYRVLIRLYQEEGELGKVNLLCQEALTYADAAMEIRINLIGSLAPYCNYK